MRNYLLDLKGRQLLGKEGGIWPNMLMFWLLCLSFIVLIIIVYVLINFREYPLYANFEDIQCHDAIHIKSGRGRAAHVQIFDVGGEEVIIRGNFAGTSGILYIDRMFDRDQKYHICFIRLQDLFLDDNSRLVGLWRKEEYSKGDLNIDFIESRINDFNRPLIIFMKVAFFPIAFLAVFGGCASMLIEIFFHVKVFE